MLEKENQFKGVPTGDLVSLRKVYQDKIDGDENDGRITASGSANLDYWMDMIEDIDKEILRREAL